MAKFIVSTKLSGRLSSRSEPRDFGDMQASLAALANGFSLTPKSSAATSPGRRATFVLEGDRSEAAALKSQMPSDMLMEEAIEYSKLDQPSVPFDLLKAGPLDLLRLMRRDAMEDGFAGQGQVIDIVVEGRTRSIVPLFDAEVHVFLAGPGNMREALRGRADLEGRVSFAIAPFWTILAILVAPYTDFWPKVVRGGSTQKVNRIVCERLPHRGPGGWWHEAQGVTPELELGRRADGGAIRVGVIDSGCGPHPALEHVQDEGAFIDGEYDRYGGRDSGTHGTHVCGTIGARGAGSPYLGVAPGVDLFSARVFPPESGANQGDIADAIDHMVSVRSVDLINMSLGSSEPSLIFKDAIDAAFEAGTLCICAAGNDAGPVSYPARYDKAVAVAAAGMSGVSPLDALPALPADERLFGERQLYAADFTNFGPEIDCIGPGVGVIAPVPARFGREAPYVSMNGTSMASPSICAALAVALAHDASYSAMRPSANRARYARMLLSACCDPAALPEDYQGSGMPNVTRV